MRSNSKLLRMGSVIALMIAVASGCTRKDSSENSPRQRLADYIGTSFAIKTPEDKQKLIGFLTGNAKIRLSAWSDEQFRSAFVDTKRQFIKLSVREIKEINDHEANITYELTYLDQGRGSDAKVTHRRLCEMVKEDGQWKIRDVQNLRELIEYKDALSLP